MFNEIAMVVSGYKQWFASLTLLMLKAMEIRTVD